MLVSYSVKNWLSFKDEVAFSMVASQEKQHNERVPFIESIQTKVLPVSAIYGGNASGKTNFFKSINFMKHFIVNGSSKNDEIITHPFLLDDSSITDPSEFIATIVIDNTCYEYGFVINQNEVLEEWLAENKKTTQKIVYHRKGSYPDGTIEWGLSKYEKDKFLNFVFQGTKKNRLFLTNAESQNVNHFMPIFNWFAETLILVAPDQRFSRIDQIVKEGAGSTDFLSKNLALLDTGVQRLGHEEIALDLLPIPAGLKEELFNGVGENETVRIEGPRGDLYTIERKNGTLVGSKVVAFHAHQNGSEVKFNLSQESDGTRRVLDLLPAYQDLESNSKVYVIDEIERSLHTLLTKALLENYLSKCSAKSKSQLLFTTHDLLLMDQNLLRRDEMWIAERDLFGASSLIGFSEYKEVRADKDLRKSYLQGRMGGVPKLMLGVGELSCNKERR